jgi:hypothetical protein
MELRAAIDIARRYRSTWTDEDLASLVRVRELVESHPRAMRSAHVRHNLGAPRMRWLGPLLPARTQVVRAGGGGFASQ